MPEFIIFEKDPETRVATITLNRPEKMNALSQPLMAELREALRDCDADPNVHAMILTGAGRAFSGGADLAQAGNRPQQRGLKEWWEGGNNEDPLFIRTLTKPLIAAVNGWCLGAAFELANKCDFIIASEQAQFGGPEIRHGSTLNTVLTWNVGPQWARYLLLSGGTIDAQKAVDIKLALMAVPHDQLMAESKKFAHTLAKIPPMAMQLNKRMIDGIMNIAGVSAGLEFGGAISTICHELDEGVTTPDGRNLKEIRQQHGLKAFLEARDAPHREMDAEQRVYDRD